MFSLLKKLYSFRCCCSFGSFGRQLELLRPGMHVGNYLYVERGGDGVFEQWDINKNTYYHPHLLNSNSSKNTATFRPLCKLLCSPILNPHFKGENTNWIVFIVLWVTQLLSISRTSPRSPSAFSAVLYLSGRPWPLLLGGVGGRYKLIRAQGQIHYSRKCNKFDGI